MASGHNSPRLVIFGCGYLGRAVAVLGHAKGWSIEALTRNPEKAERLREELGLRVVEGDLASSDWHTTLEPEDALVVNCVSSGGGGEAGYAHSYREGMKSLVHWTARGRPRAVAYTSSTSVYPDAAGAWVDETAATAETPRARILLEAEDILRRAAESGSVPSVTVLRLAGIYGPERHFLIDQVKSGETIFPGHGDQYLNLVHRDDAATAVLGALEAARPGYHCFNVSDGNPSRKAEIAAWTAARLGLPAPRFDPAIRSARQQRRSPFEGRPPHRRIASERLREALGWAPRYSDFRAGYAALLAGEGGA